MTSNVYSSHAEQAVIGGLLLDNAAWFEVSNKLICKDFYKREHQILFNLISKKLEQAESVDALTLSDEVKTIPELKEINGEIYVLELLNQTYSSTNIAAYVDIVKEYSQRRQFKEILHYLNHHSNDEAVKTLVQQAHKEFAKLTLAELPVHHGIFYQLFSDIHAQSIQWLWPKQIARGKVSIIAGNPGLGKSQITASIAAIVTSGGDWPINGSRCLPGGAIFLSAEDDPADTIRPRLEAAGADLSKTYIIKFVENKKQGKTLQRPFNLKTDLPNLEKLLKELKDIALLVIDPITAYLGQTDSYNNAEVRALLSPLSELAAKYNVAIVAVSHLNKSSGQDPLLRVSGSLAFVAAARAAFVVTPDPNDKNRRFLLPTKSNVAEDKSGFAFSIQACLLADSQIETSKVVWEEEMIHEDAYDIMKPQADPEERSALQEAMEFLSDLLKDRPLSVKKIKMLSHQSGHSWITVRRAKEQLGIVHKKELFSGDWIWRLIPTENHVAQGIQVAHTQKDEHFELFEQHEQLINNSNRKPANFIPYVSNSVQCSTNSNHVAQKAHVAQIGRDEQVEQDE